MRKVFTLLSCIVAIMMIQKVSAQNIIAGWEGNQTGLNQTGIANTEANKWGWSSTLTTATWGTANGTGVRFMDVNSSTATKHYYSDGVTIYSGREFLYRWDGTYWASVLSLGKGDGTTTTVTPFSLTACQTYTFSGKYEWWANGSTPTYLFSISTAKTGGTIIASQSYTYPSATKNLLQPISFTFTCPTTGTYYLQVAQTSGSGSTNGTLIGLADLSLVPTTKKSVIPSVSAVTVNNVTTSSSFKVVGVNLPNKMTLTAPAGITLSTTEILPADAPCGVSITATYNKTASIGATDSIIITTDTVGGTLIKKIGVSYQKPKISVYEQKVSIETNSKYYPVIVASVNNTVDTVFASVTSGFELEKSQFLLADFVNSTIPVRVKTSLGQDATGKLYLKGANGTPLDTIDLVAVAPATRYYIQHVASQLVIGSHSSTLYPALTNVGSFDSQKFILRRANINSASTIDTMYVLQDSLYRTLAKVSSSGWDTEYGYPSANAKWVIQTQSNGTTTLLNTATGKVLGCDVLVANSRLYDDKTWVAANNTEWRISTSLLTTSTDTKTINAANVFVNQGKIYVSGSAEFEVYDIRGVKIAQSPVHASEGIALRKGMYIVKTNNLVRKVIVD
ncbi:MAG: hypothetical protein RIS29_1286 [Bacteroidota bacterium]